MRDPELVQFHPSGLIEPENAAGTLVSEAARGEGGILRNALGERFMTRYDPERMELSTRDRVALAAYTEIKEGRGTPNGGVWLDVSAPPRETIMRRLPRVYQTLLELRCSTSPSSRSRSRRPRTTRWVACGSARGSRDRRRRTVCPRRGGLVVCTARTGSAATPSSSCSSSDGSWPRSREVLDRQAVAATLRGGGRRSARGDRCAAGTDGRRTYAPCSALCATR